MRIWVDGQCFQTASASRGIGRYVSELLRAMNALPEIELVVSLNASVQHQAIAARNYLRATLPRVRVVLWYGIATLGESESGYSPQRMSDDQILAAHINAIDPDIALSPSPFEGISDKTSPFIRRLDVRCMTACIFHDAIPHRFPDRYFPSEGYAHAYYRRFLHVGKFDLVLCNSNFTAEEYGQIFGKGNFLSINAGLPESFGRLLAEDLSNIRCGFDLERDYVLYVGGVDWRKNIPAIVDALALVPEVRSGAVRFVMAGDHPAQELEPALSRWRRHGLPADGIVSTGWISDPQLVKLYRHARLALQASLMEGFGLGALEAMASGCPFIAARGGAVEEVVANDSLTFDAASPEDFAALVSRLLSDGQFKAEAIDFGRRRARHYSWARSAEQAAQALHESLSQFFVSVSSARATPSTPGVLAQCDPPRLVMDVTSTAQSPVVSGIQRVIHRLSEALQSDGDNNLAQTVLTYADNHEGWFAIPRLDKRSISRDPLNLLSYKSNDRYFLIDSSWSEIAAQEHRLLNALVMGQAVVHGIHDLGPLTNPGMVGRGMPAHFRRWFEFILGHSTGIICVSRAVAEEVDAMLKAINLPRPMDIGYIRLGADFSDAPADDAWLNMLGDRPTFIMVGTIEPRKGHEIVLDAFERLWLSGVDANLLIVGKPGWNSRILQERLKVHPEAERRLFVRHGVSDGELRAGYAAASALIMASYLEGFGLPVVEAGHFGCAVILSDIPVFREVGNGASAVHFFNVGDSEDLSRKIAECAASKHRSQPRAIGSNRWADTAREVHDIVFGEKWQMHYRPREFSINTLPSATGTFKMDAVLLEADRRHRLSYVEGPILTEDGREIQFTVALCNLGDAIWSSDRAPESNIVVNIGSHIVAGDGTMLDYDNPRTAIPLVLAPGKVLYAPIYVSTDWLAQGATTVEVELVQENVGWFGTPLTIDLSQPMFKGFGLACTSDLAKLRPVVLRAPFEVSGKSGHFILIGLINTAHEPVQLDPMGGDRLKVQVVDGDGGAIKSCTVISTCSMIGGASFGLLTVHLSANALARGYAVLVTLDGGAAIWSIDLITMEAADVTAAMERLRIRMPS